MDDIRWGILGTARIAGGLFLPALAEAGGGRATIVGGRDLDRAAAWADEQGIETATLGYDAVLAADIDAVYVPLPNALHAQWAADALRAGKAVLCEKPLAVTVAQVDELLAVAAETGSPLWEAFVFPFTPQSEIVRTLLAEGMIGDVTHIQSAFHFSLQRDVDIRRSVELGGGSLLDVGCYPIRLGRLLYDAEPVSATATAQRSADGVDEQMSATLEFPGGGTMSFSCGFDRDDANETVVTGTEGEIRIPRAFHPRPADPLIVCRGDRVTEQFPSLDQLAFTSALRHIHAALREEVAPRFAAVDDARGNAVAVEMVDAASRG